MRSRSPFRNAAALGACLLAAACIGDRPAAGAGTEAGHEESATDESGYRIVEVSNGGTIRGRVRYVGAVPAARRLDVTDRAGVCGATREVQPLRLGSDAGLTGAVVSVADIRAGAAPPGDRGSVIDQQTCTFVPHVVLTAVGEPVRIMNSDPVTHNVHTTAFENRSVNRSQVPDGAPIELTFTAPERVRVRCDLHAWMSAWIVVAEHPYHAVTDEEGGFVLPNVPPGTYTLETWHEWLGTHTETVTVRAGDTVDMQIELARQP